MPDSDGYPTDEELDRLRDIYIYQEGAENFWDYIDSIWWTPEWGFIRHDDAIELHTGGWSGNEDIIDALQSNFIFWNFHYEASISGGHYYFRRFKRTNKDKLDRIWEVVRAEE